MADAADPTASRRRRIWLLAIVAAVLALLLLTSGGVMWLVGTARGTAWLLARVAQAEVTQPAGRIFGGPFSAERLEVQVGPRRITLQRLAWRDARWTWRPHDGAWVGLVIDGLSIEDLQLGAAAAAAPPTPVTEPKTLRLPFALALDELRIGRLQLEATPLLHDLVTRVEFGRDLGREHRVPAFSARSDLARVEGSARIAADPPFALEARLQAVSVDGAPRPWQAEAAATGPLAAIAVQSRLTSPQAAGAQVDLQATLSPFATWPLSALHAGARGLDLAALVADAPQTLLSGEARIETRGLDQPISAHIKLVNAQPGRWDLRRLPLTEIELDASGRADQRDRLTLHRFELRAPGDGGRASGQGQWQGGNATLDLTLHALKPAMLDARAPALTLSGTLGSRLTGLPSPDGKAPAAATLQLQSQLALEGRFDAKRSEAMRLAGALQAQRSADGWRVELRDAQARSGSAALTASLSAEQRSNGLSLLTQGQAQGFDPAPWWPAAPAARLNGRWQADVQAPSSWRLVADSAASWLALRGKAQLDVQDSHVAGVPLQAALRADNPPTGSGWNVDTSLQAAGNRAQLKGLLASRADADRWRAELSAPALAALRPLLTALGARAGTLASLEGAASAQLQADGRWPAVRTSGTLRADNVRAGTFGVGRASAQWRAGADRDAPLSLELDGERLAAGTTTLDALKAKVDGTLASHRVDVDGSSALRPPAWTDTLLGQTSQRGSAIKLRAEGRWQPGAAAPAGVWRARVAELDARAIDAKDAKGEPLPWLAARDLQLQLALDAAGQVSEAALQPGRARVLGAPLVWREARWQGATRERPALTALDAQLEPMAIAPWLARWQPDAGFGGDLTLKGSFVVHHGQNFDADIVLERAGGDLSVTTEGVTQSLGLTDLRLLLAAHQGTWHFAQAVAGANAGVLAGAQSMRLAPTASWPPPDTPMQGVLEWGVADLGVWAPFTPPGWRVGGRLRTSAAIGGRFGAPEIEGRMEGSQLAIRNLLQGVDLREGELALSLRGADARVERFNFKGGDGTLRLTGGAVLGAEPKATLQLVADKFLALGRTDRRIVTSGNATLALDAQSLALDGRFTIDEGLIDASRGEAPQLDSDITVHGGRQAVRKAVQEAEEQAAASASARTSRSLRDSRVAVQVGLGERLRLRGRGLDTRLAGQLAITAPNGKLALEGQVRAVDGQYAAYGQKLRIERGVVNFTGELENPRLDILAVRPNLDVQVGVQVEGTAQAPRVRLVSTPEMDDYDKLSWLMLGRAPEGLGRNDTALLQRAAMAILAGEDEGMDAQLLGSLGLDELSFRQVESGEVRETVVTLGKQLSQRWFVGYERSVNNTTGSWQLVYRAAQRFTLRAQSGEDNSLDAIWTWRWN